MNIDRTKLPSLDRMIPLCQVLDVSSGAFPRVIIVKLPYSDGATKPVRWRGNINLAVNDYVTIQRIGRTQDYEVFNASGSTGLTLPAPADAQYYVAALDDDLSAEIVPSLDTFKVSKLRESDDGGDAWTVDANGNLLTAGGILDLNGVTDSLVLDTDGDTSISSPTDDQIDVEVGGSDVATFTASELTFNIATSLDQRIFKNWLYHSLTHSIWQEGSTFNDVTDDTYVADVWNFVHNGQAPDVTREAGGATDPNNYYLRITFDSASSQAGIVQFIEANDTKLLLGKSMSISLDLWGTNVSNVRVALLAWTGTADSLTSDVVGTWGTGNPTLATNWAYLNTPSSSIAIDGTQTRYSVENISVGTSATNLALFIWTPDEEGSTDIVNIADVQLEIGAIATAFVPRQVFWEGALTRRFIEVYGGESAVERFSTGGRCVSTTSAWCVIQYFQKRTAPSLSVSSISHFAVTNATGGLVTATGATPQDITRHSMEVNITVASGLAAGAATVLVANSTTSARATLDARL